MPPATSSAQTPAERVSAGHSDATQAGVQRLGDLIAGSPHNLVSARDRDDIFERHITECTALAQLLPGPLGRWLDLGTGGGLPGLVLAMTLPRTTWVLVDATRKKINAVTEFVTDLGIANATAVAARAESLAHDPGHRGSYDGVVARAVAPVRVLAELARGFLKPGGHLLAMKGPTWETEVREASAALTTLRLDVLHAARLPIPGRESWVVTMRAHGAPPAGYPRRDGIPRQQPL